MPPEMAVVQLIDTLDPGGAERVAVNIANALARRGHRAFLCATRRGGALKAQIEPRVQYWELARKSRWDIGAVLRLVRLIRQHQIQIIHAHSSSLFVGSIAAALTGCKLVWHDHYGPGANQNRPAWLYRPFTWHVAWAFSVSRGLMDWLTNTVQFSADRASCLPNFVMHAESAQSVTQLPGFAGTRITCVANIRAVKDQINLLRAMKLVVDQQPSAHLLLVGAPVEPAYQQAVLAERMTLGLEDAVTLMGGREDVADILAGSDIAVLASSAEGFPLVLLEYGNAALPVVATRVGECGEILDHGAAGILVPPGDPPALAAALLRLLTDPELQKSLGSKLHTRVQCFYSEAAIMDIIETIYQTIYREKHTV